MGLPGTRILLVDDHPLFRAGVRRILESDATLHVEGEAGTAEQALSLLRSTPASLLLLDISLPDQSGVDLLPRLRESYPNLRVLYLSAHPESGFGPPLLRAGAQGYLNKQCTAAEILAAVRCVAAGDRYLPDPVRAQREQPDTDALTPHRRLGSRELQVFVRIARGLAPATTAAELNLSVKTIRSYRRRILEKLGLRSDAEMAAYAVRHHLLDSAIH